MIPDISCVIPVVPYDYVMQASVQKWLAFRSVHKSQYTWQGKDIPYTPNDLLDKMGTFGWLLMFVGGIWHIRRSGEEKT